MASACSFSEITPRRNPRRSCARKEPWKFDDDGEDILVKDDDYDDDDFVVYCSTPLSGQSPDGASSTGTPRMRYRSRNTQSAYKKFKVDYDPDNDVFIHDEISVRFNNDQLKSSIKQFMKTPGVPAYKRAISNCMKRKACANVHRPYKKRKPGVPRKRATQKTDYDSSEEQSPIPNYPLKPTRVSTLRAMLNTKDYLNRLAEKRKKAAAISGQENTSVNRQKIVESEILKGVVAFVDVISHEDEVISSVIKKELEKLGAVVVPTLTKNHPVSIILFNDGHVSTYQKAKKRGIPLVSVLWIEESRRIGTRAPVDKYPPYKMERYESPAFIRELKKRKFVYTSERIVPRKQRKKRGQVEEMNTEPSEPTKPESHELIPKSEQRGPAWLNEINGSTGVMRILVNMTGVTEEQFKDMMEEPRDSEKYETSPLPMRLLHGLARDISESHSQSSENEVASSYIEQDNLERSSEPDTKNILATPLTGGSFVTNTKKSVADTNVELSIEAKSTPVPARRVSTRPRAVRRKLSF